jgi:hypothetical protein
MIDWMIQVFRVCKTDSECSFFLAASIMDRYMDIKNSEGLRIQSKDYHLVGLVSIFIASKYEDIRPISMRKLLINVGHSKFSTEDILKCEIDVLRTLNFKMGSSTLLN